MIGNGKWKLKSSERVIHGNERLFHSRHLTVGITRVRNESLILQDTLDHVATHVDAIIAYDDASTDQTLQILLAHPKVALVIANSVWEADTMERLKAETRHRGLLLQFARERLRFEWMLCFDADERYIGDLRGFADGPRARECDGVRFRLFDAYMTPADHEPYATGRQLLDFRKFFGPERRDILTFWKNTRKVRFEGLDAREPMGASRIETDFYCQHYGKALSVEHWEETCDYYIKYFPFETYGRKWLDRKGRAIHTESDFSRPLHMWGSALFENAVKI